MKKYLGVMEELSLFIKSGYNVDLENILKILQQALTKLERIEAIDLDEVQEALDTIGTYYGEHMHKYRHLSLLQSLIDLIRSVK